MSIVPYQITVPDERGQLKALPPCSIPDLKLIILVGLPLEGPLNAVYTLDPVDGDPDGGLSPISPREPRPPEH